MGKHVLITGGAGFIGSNLALRLLGQDHQVTVLDNLSPQIHGEEPEQSFLYNLIRDKVQFLRGSVLEKADWENALEGVDTVVHLAAETGTGQSMYQVERYTDTNVKGTAIFLELLATGRYPIRRMIVASSRAIYGEGRYLCSTDGTVHPNSRSVEDLQRGDFHVKCPVCGRNVELMATLEGSELHPTSVYGITKQAQEQLFLVVGRTLNIPAIAFRYQNVYGPGQSLSNPYTGILSIFSTRILNGSDINIFEDGQESRDFVYIDDVVEATLLAIEGEAPVWDAFNVGAGTPISVIQVAQALQEAYGASVSLNVSGNFRLGDIRHNFADLAKIKQVLGFTPKVDFTTGIRNFTEWVKAQAVCHDGYEQSLQEMRERGMFK